MRGFFVDTDVDIGMIVSADGNSIKKYLSNHSYVNSFSQGNDNSLNRQAHHFDGANLGKFTPS